MGTHTLYRFRDGEGTLLYIGLTAGIGQRLAAHRRQKAWWADVALIDVEHHPDRPAVIAAERAAIEIERPRYNVQHGSSQLPAMAAHGRVYSERHARRLRRGR